MTMNSKIPWIAVAVMAFLFAANPRSVSADDAAKPEGPSPAKVQGSDITFIPAVLPALDLRNAEDVRNDRMQKWGMGLFGAGVVVSLTGVIAGEVNGYGSVGKFGLITTGAGIGITTVSFFLLGFSKAIYRFYAAPAQSPAPEARRVAGVTMNCEGSF
jgi:hypothetical protein